jgi:ABC-type dipeptide/oligopeptide/nickel transport system permease subunit
MDVTSLRPDRRRSPARRLGAIAGAARDLPAADPRRRFIIGNVIIIGWIITAILGERITPYDPFTTSPPGHLPPSPEHLMGTGPRRP